jgi:hypothetical protein
MNSLLLVCGVHKKEAGSAVSFFAINLLLIVVKVSIPDIFFCVLNENPCQAPVTICPEKFILMPVVLSLNFLVCM